MWTKAQIILFQRLQKAVGKFFILRRLRSEAQQNAFDPDWTQTGKFSGSENSGVPKSRGKFLHELSHFESSRAKRVMDIR